MIEKIRNLIQYLPKEDIVTANAFIDMREFECLNELIDSNIKKVTKNVNTLNDEYAGVELPNLIELKTMVESYIEQLNLPIDLDDEEYS